MPYSCGHYCWRAVVKGITDVPSFKRVSWLLKKRRGQWVVFPSWQKVPQYFDTVGWVTGRASGLRKTCSIHCQRFSFWRSTLLEVTSAMKTQLSKKQHMPSFSVVTQDTPLLKSGSNGDCWIYYRRNIFPVNQYSKLLSKGSLTLVKPRINPVN